MFALILRVLRVIGIVLGLVVVASAAGAIPAAASGGAHIHIFHTLQWYQQHPSATANPLDNKLHYYGGRVMHTSTTYAIYWAPGSHTISTGYQTLVNRYFQDIGSSRFYKITTQYFEKVPGKTFILNQSTLGGTWVDSTNAYPHAGNFADPLQDSDIQAEVLRAIAANAWSTGYDAEFFVYTAPGITSCIDASTCTPGTGHPAFCAYHGLFTSSNQNVLYANMPYAASWGANCGKFTTSPNGNADADTEISITSHEHFEAVTDANPPPFGPEPPTTAWTDAKGYEIGDKCAYSFGAIALDGSNLKLHGHPYIVQLEYSNAANSGKGGCVKKY